MGLNILGNSGKEVDLKLARQMFGDNPLDQSDQQTPIAIARKMPDDYVEPDWDNIEE